MRSLGILVVVVAQLALLAVVHGKPLGRDRDLDFLDDSPPDPCFRAKSMKLVTKCLDKQGKTSLEHDSTDIKVVRLALTNTTNARLHVYAKQRDANWQQVSVLHLTAVSELMSLAPWTTPNGAALRIDIGQMTRTSISIDSLSSTRGVLRRVSSTVCLPPHYSCRAMVTSCEALVRGKVYWWFRGELVWHPSLGLRMRGQTTHAGRSCMPPASFMVKADE